MKERVFCGFIENDPHVLLTEGYKIFFVVRSIDSSNKKNLTSKANGFMDLRSTSYPVTVFLYPEKNGDDLFFRCICSSKFFFYSV